MQILETVFILYFQHNRTDGCCMFIHKNMNKLSLQLS